MRIGIGLPAAIPNVESSTLVRWAVRAEQRAFDSIGVVDRVCYGNHDPLTVLAAAAAVTERVELLTDILIAPLRNTVLLAKQAATLDRLSRGRLTLGVGIGGRVDDCAAVGLPAAGRGRRFEEQLAELRRIWRGSSIGPEPAQPGGPPLLVAGYVEHAIERAASAGDGWTAGVGTVEQFAQGLDVLRSAWGRHGRAGRPRVLAMAYFALGANAREAAERDLLHYYGWLGPELCAQIASLALTDAGSVGEWLAAYAEAGAGEALFVPTSPEPEQVDLLADAVAELRPSRRVAAAREQTMTTVRDTERTLAGTLVTVGDPGWDVARSAWNLTVDQRPAAVVLAESAADVAAAVHFAARRDLRVAAQGTGHGAAMLGSLERTVLVKTAAMRGIEVDRERCVARVEAGVVWRELVDAAAAHGLAALAGSSPDVGVVGYALGGGLGWLGRKHGLAANAIEAAEIVTADGRILRVDRETEPDLFWAIRGGGGGFGVVTAVWMRLFPIREVVAGILWWPIERVHEVLDAWRELTESRLPDELTTVGRLLQFPPLDELPEPLRGRSFVVVEIIHLGDAAEADEVLTPLRALGPESDTIGSVPVESLSSLHMDPEQPTPMVGDGFLLDALTPDAIDALIKAAGAGSGSPLVSVELRQLGGELARARPGDGALASLEASYALFAVGIAPTPEAEAHVARHAQLVRLALAPWTAKRSYLNFAETPIDPAAFWPETAYRRLRRIKSAIDPANRIRSNHEPL